MHCLWGIKLLAARGLEQLVPVYRPRRQSRKMRESFLIALVAFAVSATIVWSFDCSTLPDGNYEIGCKSYVHCVGHKGQRIYCQKKMVYNIATGVCDDPLKVPSPCGVHRDCSTKTDGRYPDLERKCHFYYVCMGGKFTGHNPCPAGLVFNITLGICDWPEHVAPPCGTRTTLY